MEFVPSRHQGQLIVAAIRVLSHLHEKPPTENEIGDLLQLSEELVLHVLRGLEARGIVRPVRTPFEVRYDIEDSSLLETLPLQATGPDIGHEIEDFHKRTEDRQKEIERMMREGDPEQKARQKVSKIEEEFHRFRAKKSGGALFRQTDDRKEERT